METKKIRLKNVNYSFGKVLENLIIKNMKFYEIAFLFVTELIFIISILYLLITR